MTRKALARRAIFLTEAGPGGSLCPPLVIGGDHANMTRIKAFASFAPDELDAGPEQKDH